VKREAYSGVSAHHSDVVKPWLRRREPDPGQPEHEDCNASNSTVELPSVLQNIQLPTTSDFSILWPILRSVSA